MLFLCRTLAVLSLALASASNTATAAVPDGLASALDAWRNGDSDAAWKKLTQLVENDSDDPRAYIARGILAEELGKPSENDLRKGASLEAASGNTRLVDTLLEPVQGPLRARIEKYRFEARAALKPDPSAELLKGVFREALELRRTRQSAAALEKFEQLTATGNDPRYFYMHGILLAETGNQPAAARLFSEALARETSLREMQLVNDLLAGLDGNLRLLVEDLAKIDVNGEIITRRLLRDELRRRALMSEEQLLAESNAAAEAADREAKAAQDARRRSAVEQILADRSRQEARQQEMTQTLSGQNQPSPEPAVASTDAPATTNPAAPASPAAPTSPAAPKNPANPFLSGNTAPRTQPTPPTTNPSNTANYPASAALNLSWLPPNTELLIAVRPADIAASPSVQAAGGAAAFDAAIPQLQQLQLSISDVESLTVGISDILLAVGPLITQAAAGNPPNPEAQMELLSKKGLGVLRLSKDFDAAAVAAAVQAKQATADGTTYYIVPAPQPGQPDVAWFAPDARTLVTGSEAAIKIAISSGAGESTLENFTFVPGNSQAVIAFSSPLLAGLSAAIDAPPNAPAPIGALADAVKGKINGAAIAINYDTDIALDVLLNLIDEDAAGEAGKALVDALALGKQMAPLVMGTLPQPLIPGIQQLVNSLSSSNRSTVLILSASIPASLVEAIQQNPGLFMPQGLPGAPGLPGGAPGGFPAPPGLPGIPGSPGSR